MKKIAFVAGLISFISSLFAQKVDFSKYFENAQLRIDYIRAGNINSTNLFLYELHKEPYWGGPKTNLIDTFNYGFYRFEAYDAASNQLIYAKTYSTLFNEWLLTNEAKVVSKAFVECVNMPYPKNKIYVKFYKSDRKNNYIEEARFEIDPSDLQIKRNNPPAYKVLKLLINGPSDKKIDIVFIAEGYTAKEEKKFISDAQKFIDYLFDYEPFSLLRNKFNFYAICSFSPDSGTDIPQNNIWARTVVNSSFNTFGIDRYLTSLDIKSIYEVASCAPYDQICVLVNTDKYGGGGFYNFFNLTASRNFYAKNVFVHEFGHSFGGLADEYFESEEDPEFDMYPLDVEPREPNITTLVNFQKKWKNLVNDTLEIPTHVGENYKNVVGVFEGGGYRPKGIYRSQISCLMKELNAPFCAACKNSLLKIIDFLTN